ncbi:MULTISPECIES: DGQHR domain-containing protein [Caballeronia]|uniref:DGQHR domain-containing protein n=1 Tax=Caballeronia TaxID=1827195 RepID=UPI00158CB48C|nr:MULTISPECIES: DGQHR domain-containing protein [Caballeronia]MCG7402009.1 DGQHR domain-containing protein [Caballeronia zhejiangensis]MCI1042588.1 DGQHR domain-containing protein [Caballeronia zhejiangensis]
MAKQQPSFIEVKQGGRKFILTKLPASVVTKISYAAVRGQSSEEGAIQRMLNQSRISGIKDFTLAGGDYPNAIVLNWVNDKNPIARANGKLTFADERQSAQIIDGQHRIAGIRAAIEERADIGKLELPVVIYEKLSTKECADIFLAINEEQKPAPRSLVFDLFGIASADLVDAAAVRARDIATFLNQDGTSPYQDEIKFPGHKTRKGGIALSTAVSAIKPLVEDKGALEQIDIHELEIQRQIIVNVFSAIQQKYGPEWDSKTNAFMYAAGFMGALEFLRLKLVPYCNLQGSFEVETIAKSLDLSKESLILQENIKGLGGASASKAVYDRLVDVFRPQKKSTVKIKV